MAIDIKELRVGAHVSIGGERREVFGLGCGRVSYLPHPLSSIAESVLAEEVEPIPITEELLTELGFHEVKDTYFSDWHNGWLKITNNTGQAKPYWVYNGFIKLYYLHQLEALYYATTKTELIKE